MKISPLRPEFFYGFRRADRQTDRQTDITKLIVAFRYFAKPPKQIYIILTLSFLGAILRLSAHSTPKILRLLLFSPATFHCENKASSVSCLTRENNFVFLNCWIIKWLHIYIIKTNGLSKSLQSNSVFVASFWMSFNLISSFSSGYRIALLPQT